LCLRIPVQRLTELQTVGVSQLGLKFAAFFEKLTIMMGDFAKHLDYLSKCAATFLEYPDVQNVRY
jgi:hypothetical protein